LNAIFEENTLRELREYLEGRKIHDIFKTYDDTSKAKIQQETIVQTL
jgi:hypothetical protein